MSRHRAEPDEIHDLNMSALHMDKTALLKTRQNPAYRLQLHAEQAADLVASHAPKQG